MEDEKLRQELAQRYSDHCASKAAAAQVIEDMNSRYVGNFDFLNDDGAIDAFLDNFVRTLDDSVVFPTPDIFRSLPNAGSITRFEDDVFYVGIDEDFPVRGDIVPSTLDYEGFFRAVDKIIVKHVNCLLEVPAIEIVLADSTKETSSDYVGPIVKQLVQKAPVFIDPPYAVRNYCALKAISVVDYQAVLNAPNNRYHGQTMMTFNIEDVDMAALINKGMHVVNFVLCPYLPQAVKYTKKVKRKSDNLISVTFFFGRKTVRFKYCDCTQYRRYLPVEWADHYAIPLGNLFREWACYEIRTDTVLNCSTAPRRSYFNYVVEASVNNVPVTTPFLDCGHYCVRDIPGEVVVAPGCTLVPCPLVSITPLGAHEASVTVLNGRRAVTFMAHDGYPRDASYFMLRGEYYYRCKSSTGKHFKFLINHTIITEFANMHYSAVNYISNVSVTGLNYMFHQKGEAAYRHMIMCNPVQYPDTAEGVGLTNDNVVLGIVPIPDL